METNFCLPEIGLSQDKNITMLLQQPNGFSNNRLKLCINVADFMEKSWNFEVIMTNICNEFMYKESLIFQGAYGKCCCIKVLIKNSETSLEKNLYFFKFLSVFCKCK